MDYGSSDAGKKNNATFMKWLLSINKKPHEIFSYCPGFFQFLM